MLMLAFGLILQSKEKVYTYGWTSSFPSMARMPQ
jgi:hypothetical protein